MPYGKENRNVNINQKAYNCGDVANRSLLIEVFPFFTGSAKKSEQSCIILLYKGFSHRNKKTIIKVEIVISPVWYFVHRM